MSNTSVLVYLELAYSLGVLGEIYAKQGRTREAEPLLRKASGIMELQVSSTNDSLTVARLFRLGVWYILQGRLSDAERIYEKAVALCREAKRPRIR